MPDFLGEIRKRRLQWEGHVWRKEGTSWIQTIQDSMLEGKRPLGRPRKRWEDQVKGDIENFRHGKIWQELAMNRE